MKVLTVHFTEDEEGSETLEYLEEAIEQAGGFVLTVEEVFTADED